MTRSRTRAVPDFEELLTYRPPCDLLARRVILVTGAAEGINRAVARAYATHGATTILLDRDVGGLEALRATLAAARAPEPMLVPMDLATATTADYRALASSIDARYRRLDGLTNNAGWIGALAPFEHTEPNVWAAALTVNLVAPFFLTQWCMPLIRRGARIQRWFSLCTTYGALIGEDMALPRRASRR